MWVNKAAPRSHSSLGENAKAEAGLPPYKLLIKETSETPKTSQIIPIVGCLAELVSKTLLLRMPHALVVGRRETKLGLVWRLLPCWLTLTVLEGTVETT